MIIPELPAYLTSLGGAEYKGLIISLFTLTAGISRPFSGKLSDTIGRMPVMIIGTLVCVVCSAMYPLLTTVYGFLFLRFLHGFSTGFKPTASTAYVADIVPAHRRGEALGILGVSMNTGASIAPPIGSYLAQSFSLNTMFYASSAAALVSILVLLGLKETLPNKQAFEAKLLKISRSEILDPSAIAPALVTLVIYFCFGALLTITPDHSEFVGLSNKGMYFAAFTATSVLSRLVAGRVSDRYGRIPVIKVSSVLVAMAMVSMGLATTGWGLLLASGFVGFAVGIAAPAVFAWTIDRSAEDRRGRAMATVYIALEIGIGSGALISAWIYDNEIPNLSTAYFFSAAVALLGVLYLQFVYRMRE